MRFLKSFVKRNMGLEIAEGTLYDFSTRRKGLTEHIIHASMLVPQRNSGGSELEIADEHEHDKTVFFEVSQE